LYLTREEELMLEGHYGEAVETAMEVLVRIGDAYGAGRMVGVASGHLVSCIYNVVFEAGVEVVEALARAGGRLRVPSTLCTGSAPLRNPGEFRVPGDWLEGQRRLAAAFEGMGAVPLWSCTPYLHVNVPRFGQNIAWGESNCVCYANSVIGARTNRYPSYVELCAALAGRVPEFGLHLDENRRGQVLFELKGFGRRALSDVDYPLIGYAVGLVAVDRVPVITGIPNDVGRDQLKALGAAAASSGSVALYHAVEVTPEARTLKDAFRGERPSERVEIGPGDLSSAREELSTVGGGRVDLVAVGCPHYTLDQVAELANLLRGKRIADGVEFWVCTNRIVEEAAERMGYGGVLRAAGVKVMTDSCVLNGPTFTWNFETMATDSAKFAHYGPMQAGCNAIYAGTGECVEAAVRGEIG